MSIRTPHPAPSARRAQDAADARTGPPDRPHGHLPRGRWIAPTAAAWWAVSAVVALAVTLSGRALPVGDGDTDWHGTWIDVPAAVLTPWVAALAVCGALLAAWTWRGGLGVPVVRAVRAVTVVGVVVVLAGAVTLVDASVLARLGYLPVTAVMAPFDADVRSAFAASLTPGAALQTAVLGGAALLAAATVRFVRRTADACESCGRRVDGNDPGWTSPGAAARWGRAAALVAAAIPVLYASTRIAWVLGIPLGVPAEFIAELTSEDGWIAALGLGAFALTGTILTLGLFQRWGEVFPRWMVGLAGRRVPITLAVVPATVVAAAVLPAGLSLIVTGLRTGGLSLAADRWGAVGPELLWPLWSVALGAATYAYWLRRRGTCRACGGGARTPVGTPGRAPQHGGGTSSSRGIRRGTADGKVES